MVIGRQGNGDIGCLLLIVNICLIAYIGWREYRDTLSNEKMQETHSNSGRSETSKKSVKNPTKDLEKANTLKDPWQKPYQVTKVEWLSEIMNTNWKDEDTHYSAALNSIIISRYVRKRMSQSAVRKEVFQLVYTLYSSAQFMGLGRPETDISIERWTRNTYFPSELIVRVSCSANPKPFRELTREDKKMEIDRHCKFKWYTP